jgi:hypothetical protein
VSTQVQGQIAAIGQSPEQLQIQTRVFAGVSSHLRLGDIHVVIPECTRNGDTDGRNHQQRGGESTSCTVRIHDGSFRIALFAFGPCITAAASSANVVFRFMFKYLLGPESLRSFI